MLYNHSITTNNQKVLRFLAKFSDKEFFEREVSRQLGISSGSANRALNELHSSEAALRRREGKMYFYFVNPSNTTLSEFKKIMNLSLIEPLLEILKKLSNRVILYGSCAEGTDTSDSDIDLFIVSMKKKEVVNIISDFKFPKGYENITIQSIVKTPVELLEASKSENAFLQEVESGLILWEKSANE